MQFVTIDLQVLSLMTFICSCIDTWETARWAQFQSAFAVIATSVYLVLYLLNLISRLPGPWPLIVSIKPMKLYNFCLLCCTVWLVMHLCLLLFAYRAKL